MKTLQVDTTTELLQAIDNQFEHVCVLDSAQLQEKYSRYDALVLAGNEIVQGKFEDAVNKDDTWKFGYISYEFKNTLEELRSQHQPKVFDWPYLFVRAELVIAIRKGNLEVLKGIIPDQTTWDFSERLPRLEFQHRIDKDTYLQKVNSLLHHIQQGNIYEINFCQEFFVEQADVSMIALFNKMRETYPSPFISYLKLNSMYAVCNSPERFMMRTGDRLVSQPIKGTAPRKSGQREDEMSKQALSEDPKERSENIMITDLVRNDLSKHAIPGSVKVEELCGVYTFPLWHQMISTIVAEVKPNTTNADVIKGAFPMGSMTGAPKIRAMELIDEHESFGRGLYSGSIGYISPNGDFDFNVVIRTFLYNKTTKYLSYSTGGAITNKSVPEKEYEECLLKAKLINQLFDGSDQGI